MKRLYIFIAALSSMSLLGCLKDTPNNDFTKIGTVVEMPYSGKGFFTTDAVTDAGDTISKNFTINIASANVLSTATTVTVVVDPTLVDAYNSFDTSVHYLMMPADAYEFDAAPVTIPAGSRLDTLHVTFFKNKLDPTLSYMLPLAIKDASGHTISGNMSVHYYHFIGNPIAGSYSGYWERWNTATQTGSPTFTDLSDYIFSPVSPTTIAVPSGTGVTYLLSFKNTGGVLSDFTVKFGPDDLDPNIAGIAITGGPTIVSADPIAGVYKFNFTYDNLNGGLRNINDTYTKQ